MIERKYLICEKCGKLETTIKGSKCPTMCCGQAMTEIKPNVKGDKQKHLPMVTIDGNTVNVSVGEVNHPMESEHFIEWIYLQTKKGGQCKCLKPGCEPKASFALIDDEVVAIYSYCNLHGLWITKL